MGIIMARSDPQIDLTYFVVHLNSYEDSQRYWGLGRWQETDVFASISSYYALTVH